MKIDSRSRDPIETERLNPEQSLIQRRHARDEQDYRDWCEGLYGTVKLGPEEFHPADVFDQLAPDAARRGRDDAASQARTDLEQAVSEQFPAPIAVPFQGFLEGPRSPQARLHRLRDTWESLVHLLAAIALSEAANLGVAMAPLVVRESKDQRFRECKRRDFFSDKLSIRIGLIEGVLHRSQVSGCKLGLSSFLPLDVLAEIRRLNVVRNGFAHDLTKSEKQAQEIIDDAYPVVQEVLLDLREIRDIELIRVKRIFPGTSSLRVEAEKLMGHAQSQRIREFDLAPSAATTIISAGPVDGIDRVFARMPSITLDLSPFFYATDDDTGHRTRILVFRGYRNAKWCLACVGDSTSRIMPARAHQELLRRFDSLIGSAGEGLG